MFTLSDASKDTKQFLKWAGIILASVIFLLILIKMGIIVKEMLFPTPPPKATIAFGKLQPQIFPQNSINQELSYTIDTLSGFLPIASQTARIYRIELPPPDLLAINKFEDRVVNIDFNKGYTAISDKVFEWKNNSYTEIKKTLTVNITTNNFIISSGYLTDAGILSGKNLPNQPKAIDKATEMLSSMNFLSDDIDLEKTTTNLYSIQNGALVSSTSLSNSQVIEVNFFQKDVDKLPIYYEKPNLSNIRILIGGGTMPQVVAANYIHQIISQNSSTYPVKSSTQAFEDLRQGKGYIAAYSSNNSNIVINNVSLGYYIGSQTQDFLMPIFVFKGNNNFVAYVPAITDEWINK